ncbi:MAG TPA: hypothetical protein VJ770_30385 [Stellaceae bacterium]|nr:hypothetical protein [Stellaceae bacterium]
MAPVPFTPRLRRLLWSGMLAGISGVALAGLSSPAHAQYNPYCYAPYYNAYYCQYYSYNYNYPAYPYNSYSYYNYPYYGYPYYGFGLAAPLGFGLGFSFGGGHHDRRDYDRGFAGREFHGDNRGGFSGGEFHGGHRGGPPAGAGGSSGGFHPSPVQQYFAPVFNAARHNGGGGGGGHGGGHGGGGHHH